MINLGPKFISSKLNRLACKETDTTSHVTHVVLSSLMYEKQVPNKCSQCFYVIASVEKFSLKADEEDFFSLLVQTVK